jgi:DNA-binding MurR/RpiR family transcriptional regulator
VPEQDELETLESRISARLAKMAPAERRVAEYLRNHQEEVVFASAEEIGAAAGVSDATVVRTAKTLGYSGMVELKFSIGQETLARAKPIQRLQSRIEEVGADAPALWQQLFREAHDRLRETERQNSGAEFTAAVDLIDDARSVVAFGIGPSESIAQYLALMLARRIKPARATGATGFRLADDLLNLEPGDVLILFSPARLLREHEVILSRADEVGAKVILVTDSLEPVLGDRVDLVLRAVYSVSGFTGETLSSLVLADALVLALGARGQERAAERMEKLTDLRSSLIESDSRNLVRRTRRRTAPS